MPLKCSMPLQFPHRVPFSRRKCLCALALSKTKHTGLDLSWLLIVTNNLNFYCLVHFVVFCCDRITNYNGYFERTNNANDCTYKHVHSTPAHGDSQCSFARVIMSFFLQFTMQIKCWVNGRGAIFVIINYIVGRLCQKVQYDHVHLCTFYTFDVLFLLKLMFAN